jgi:hypothetical protein
MWYLAKFQGRDVVSELDLTRFFGESAVAAEKEEIVKDDEEAEEPDVTEDDEPDEPEDGEPDEGDEPEEEEPEDEPDEAELKRRDFQAKADRIEHQNKLLLQQNQELQNRLKQNNQTDIDEDDFAGIDDEEYMTVGHQKKIQQRKEKKQREALLAQEAQQADLANQRLWMQSQPDYTEVDQFYIENKAAMDQMLQIDGTTSIKESYYAIKAAKKEADLDAMISKTKSLEKKNKKLRKKKKRVPQTGPGGASTSPSSQNSGLDMGDFFNRGWNR